MIEEEKSRLTSVTAVGTVLDESKKDDAVRR